MKHYFVQHGKAHSKDIDETRPLSDDGIDETLAIAKQLTKNKLLISQICHSGKKRAAQTAEIIAAELGLNSTQIIEWLNPNDDVKHFSQTQLTQLTADTMFVGHLPHLNRLVSYLLCNDETANCVTFQNSAIVCIDTIDGESSLLWYITPETNQ